MQLPVKHLGKNVNSRARLPRRSDRRYRLPCASTTSMGGAAQLIASGGASVSINNETALEELIAVPISTVHLHIVVGLSVGQ